MFLGKELSPERKKICVNRGHTGLVATAKARISLFLFWVGSILPCHHHHRCVSEASIMYVTAHGPAPICPGMVEWEGGARSPEHLGQRQWFINVSFMKDPLYQPCTHAPFEGIIAEGSEELIRRPWLEVRRAGRSVGTQKDNVQEGRHLGQLCWGPALSLVIESIASSYKRTDNWLPKSL